GGAEVSEWAGCARARRRALPQARRLMRSLREAVRKAPAPTADEAPPELLRRPRAPALLDVAQQAPPPPPPDQPPQTATTITPTTTPPAPRSRPSRLIGRRGRRDRKSTRLNSSH